MCIKFELETSLPFEVTSGIQNYPVFRRTLFIENITLNVTWKFPSVFSNDNFVNCSCYDKNLCACVNLIYPFESQFDRLNSR